MKNVDALSRKLTRQKTHNEVISIMIQYFNNELPISSSEKRNLIANNCQECKQLLEEMAFFFDEQEVIRYEMLNKKSIEESKNSFRKLVQSQLKTEHVKNTKEISKNSKKVILGKCFCDS